MKRSRLIEIIREELQLVLKEESTQYNIEGLLLTNTEERPQKDILSDIRSLPGITIVSSKDYDLSGETSAFSNPNYYTVIKIKVDPHPYPNGFTDEDLQANFNGTSVCGCCQLWLSSRLA